MLARAENALLQALRTHRDCKRLLRTMETLPQLPLEKLLNRYAADAPAMYVVPGRFTVQDDCATLRFSVACVARNVAGQAQSRKGDGIDLGTDHLVLLATRALHAHNLGGCNWNLEAGQAVDEDVFDQAGIAAVELQFVSTPVPLDADWAMQELDDFLLLHADLDSTHAGAAEHAKWVATPPDFSASAPGARLDVPLTGAADE